MPQKLQYNTLIEEGNIPQQQLQQSLKQNTIKHYILSIIIGTIIVFIMSQINDRQVSYLSNGSNNSQNSRGKQSLYLRVWENDRLVRLAYLEPELINFQKILEDNLTQLTISQEQYRKIDQMKISPIQLRKKLYLNWLSQPHSIQQQYLYKAQYIYYNNKYSFDPTIPEKQICVVSPYRNLLTSNNQSYKIYLRSINEQNYSNYHIYMIDDMSDDDSVSELKNITMHYPRLRNRLTIVQNRDNVGALGNRDFVTRNYCGVGAVVLDIDGDDAIIGWQVFNFINRFYYNNPNAWFVYTNFLSILGSTDGSGRSINLQYKMQPGFCTSIKQSIFQSNTYRTSQQWVTSLLRTYLRDLYIKIPLSHVLQQGTRKYYIEATDRFSMYALAQLAGQNHTFYVEEYMYFYYEPNYVILQSKGCRLFLKFYAEAQARILPPLKNLGSLLDHVEVTKEYRPADWVLTLYARRRKQYYQCLQKQQNKRKNNIK